MSHLRYREWAAGGKNGGRETREKVIKSVDLNGGWSGVGWEKYGEDIAKAWM